jgi:diguanylate cyclase (GGDEF)-like protein
MKKILIIEDEEFIRENLLELLEAESFEVISADNGVQGLQLATEELPHLILCDIMMPEMDGYGVLTALRENPKTASIPFIFMTARAERMDIRVGMELGADDYLIKPCTPPELLKAVTTRLARHSAIEQRYLHELQQATSRFQETLLYDPLTKLPNRLSLQEQFENLLPQINQQLVNQSPAQSLLVAVFCIALDRFKRINENFGYEFGDLLLQLFAKRLSNLVKNQGTVARLNSYQFVVILTQLTPKEAIIEFALQLKESLSEAYILSDQEVFMTTSMGIALYPQDAQSMNPLLQAATKAMESAKQQGGNVIEFYTPALQVGVREQLSLETDLRHALEREELEIYYQPQVSLKTGKIVGCETLLRWQHQVHGFISPGRFIPVAEETGLIEQMGLWVLQTACRQMKAWSEAGLGLIRIAVNLSGRQFNQLNLCQSIIETLVKTDLDPSCLELELTESTLVKNPERAIQRLNSLKEIGVQIAIDDFGTGYSSLSYLHQFPFDTLKIDRSFVFNLTKNYKNRAITTALIQMAHQLRLNVIAEGVETAEELMFMQQHECDEMQGYFFSKPVPARDFENLLLKGQCLPELDVID